MNKQKGSGEVVAFVAFSIITMAIILLAGAFTMDWTTGEHGRLTITSVDKNLFGTYTIYARNSDSMSGNELNEVTYCIDADNVLLAEWAKDKIGVQDTTLVYPERRIGFYWFDKCHSAPVKDIK